MNPEYLGSITLLVLLILSIAGRNNALSISISGLLFISLIGQMGGGMKKGAESLLLYLDKNGLKIGMIIFMMGILAPFALGKLNFMTIISSFKTYKGFIGVLAGILVAVFGAKGGYLLEIQPSIVTSVVMGTIVGIVVFKGYPVGPLIGSGIAYFFIYMTEWFMKK